MDESLTHYLNNETVKKHSADPLAYSFFVNMTINGTWEYHVYSQTTQCAACIEVCFPFEAFLMGTDIEILVVKYYA